MRIGIISDTHGRFVQPAIIKMGKIDVLIHLGDHFRDIIPFISTFEIPIHYVKGNCDAGGNAPLELQLNLSGKKFLVTHGHKYDVKMSMKQLMLKADSINADVVLYGHTHIPEIFEENSILFMNPGSPSYPKTLKGPTVGIIEILDNRLAPYLISIG
ncbi:MAG TPA: metallophosphoesterase [Candidatus Atribacteria bacterium]|nr:metallophosphoesterase [Candidatus Atribacteria bacterium]